MDEYVNVDGLRIAYRISGDPNSADTAVILQGWGTTYRLYDIVANILGDRFKTVQFDLPGFGASEEPDRSWTVEDYKEFFVKFLKELGIGSCMLIGHSYGGRVIIKLAGSDDCPVDITKIVLMDSAGVLPVRTFKQKYRQTVYKILKKILNSKVIYFLFDEIIDDWKSRQGSEDYRNASPIMKGALVSAVNEDLTSYLPHIKVPTLLVWGDKDTATPMRDAHIMEKEIPDSKLFVIPDTGHFSYAENPALFAEAVNTFLGNDN